jgi:formylglycine-generating enzyme required for sulfatase activity
VWCNAYSEKTGKEPVYYTYGTDGTDGTVLRTSTTAAGTGTDADKAVMKAGVNGYRLPTEAEWEYAARGGGTPSLTAPFTNKWAGTNIETELVNYAWYDNNSHNLGSGNPDYGAHPAGTKKANGAGLYDMSGNVLEWCWDWYGAVNNATGPTGPVAGTTRRVVRGGSWYYGAVDCAVAFRNYSDPVGRNGDMGFRVVVCP